MTPALRSRGDVPVERLDAQVLTFPTDGPEADGTLSWDATTMILVEASAAGVTGLGWTYGAPATAHVVRELLGATVLGRSALAVPAAHEAMGRAVRNAGRPGLVAGALSAVDIALWDLKARLLDLPLVALLGPAREEVPVYGSGGFTTYDARRLDEELGEWTGLGITRVKIKIAESWGSREDRDLARVEQARLEIGRGAELYVDANGGYTRKQAVRIGRELAALGVTWFEEPVSSDDLTGLALVRDALSADVTAGEYGYDLPYFARMIPAVDCLQADATRCGGLTGWLRAAALAEAHGLQLSGHCAPHVHAHAAAAIPNLRHLEWFHDHVRAEEELFDGTLSPRGGVLRPGADGAPGLGLTLRPDRAAAHRTG